MAASRLRSALGTARRLHWNLPFSSESSSAPLISAERFLERLRPAEQVSQQSSPPLGSRESLSAKVPSGVFSGASDGIRASAWARRMGAVGGALAPHASREGASAAFAIAQPSRRLSFANSANSDDKNFSKIESFSGRADADAALSDQAPLATSATGVGPGGSTLVPAEAMGVGEQAEAIASATSAHVSEIAGAMAEVWAPTAALQLCINAFHESLGLPWWLAIATMTVCMRAVMFPVMIFQIKNAARQAIIAPHLVQMANRVKAYGYTPEEVRRYQEGSRALLKKHKVNMVAPFAGALVQGSTFIFFFFAIRGMVEQMPSLSEGGILWFQNLAVCDPLYVLPVVTGLGMLASVELGAMDGMEMQQNANAKNMKLFMRGMALVSVVVTATFPAGLFCYMVPNTVLSILQGLVLKVKSIRSALGLPLTPPPPPPSDGPTLTDFFSSFTQQPSGPTQGSQGPLRATSSLPPKRALHGDGNGGTLPPLSTHQPKRRTFSSMPIFDEVDPVAALVRKVQT